MGELGKNNWQRLSKYNSAPTSLSRSVQFLDACEECKNGERLGEEVAGINTPPA
jgi:hypothetical protein